FVLINLFYVIIPEVEISMNNNDQQHRPRQRLITTRTMKLVYADITAVLIEENVMKQHLRLGKAAKEALIHGSEMFLRSVFADATQCAEHAGRATPLEN
ncbi:unnamed protein product, partial [Didymodactylos carnosus]